MVDPEFQQKHGRRKLNIGNLEEFLYRVILVPLVAFLPARLAYGIGSSAWRVALSS